MVRFYLAWCDLLINALSSLAFIYLGALAAAIDWRVMMVAYNYGIFWLYLLFGLVVVLMGLSVFLSWLTGYSLNE